ncbi:MAG: carbon-nitrogen hydrolase family protein [Anaerolineae bacterium]|nr:carbon-nitrogen hydrolase family protein [Anaerolineae bacterium]
MRVCLIPLKTELRNPKANLERLIQRLAEVAPYHPDLVCFPECTLTGYLYAEEDFVRFAEPIPGPTTEQLSRLAQTYSLYLCCGLLESTPEGIYNAAVLFNRAGKIIFKHRKVYEQPPFINGDAVGSVETEFGRLSLLICGDLPTEHVVRRLDPATDWLLVPMARSFDGPSPDEARWIAEERQDYLDAVKNAGVAALIVNALDLSDEDTAFGGALVAGAGGELLAESPHGTDVALIWDCE